MTGRWLVVALVGMLLLTACNSRQTTVLTPAQVAARARPATLLIFAKVEVSGSIPKIGLSSNRLSNDAMMRVGAGASDHEKAEQIITTLLNAPGDYLREGEGSTPVKGELEMLGTGFVVTPDGYILTNAHVVRPDKRELTKEVLERMPDKVDEDYKAVHDGVEHLLAGETIGNESSQRLREAFNEQVMKGADLNENSQVVAVFSTQGSDGRPDARPCEIKKVGAPIPGKDVAVLKVEGRNLATLPLAQGVESGSVTTGSDLLIMGYPGKVFEDPDITNASKLQPSLTFGHVSGIREMAGGFHVIQTDATINHGNSGGPALNDYGEVVGQATFMEADSQGLNFAIDIGVAREFLQELHVIPNASSAFRAPQESHAPAETYRATGRQHGRFPVGVIVFLLIVVVAVVAVAVTVARN